MNDKKQPTKQSTISKILSLAQEQKRLNEIMDLLIFKKRL